MQWCFVYCIIRSIPPKGYEGVNFSSPPLVSWGIFTLMPLAKYLPIVGVFASLVLAQTFEEQPSLAISNGELELTILKQGATLANLVLAKDTEKLSPLWNPMRMSRELGNTPRFNGGAGHFVCVDGFGPVSQEESAAGLRGHGEAHVQMFEQRYAGKEGKANVVTMSATLPIVQEVLTRTFRMVDGENVIYVESQLENLLGFDRPVNWAEHATIGSPFLASGVTVIDVSGSRSQTRPYPPNNRPEERLAAGQNFTWPMAPGMDGKSIDMRVTPENPHYVDHAATLIDPKLNLGWVTALNPQKRLIFGYVFKREEYPWLQHWGNYPANQKMARGMEFGTQPYDVPRREAVSAATMFDTPTYRWLPAKSKIETRFLLFYARVPEGFEKVDEVRLENGQLRIEDRTAKKQVRLAASLW